MEYTKKQLKELTGAEYYGMYERLNEYILDSYNVNQQWDKGGKDWEICLRYGRSGKTLCTVYFRRGRIGVMVIFGKEERKKFEETESRFSETIRNIYYGAKTYHDGKWMMFDVNNAELLDEIKMLLEIKKSPNRILTMCGYCCDMCKAFVGNTRKKDEREILAGYWKRYYGLNIPVENMNCDGCRCKKADAHRVDDACPVRACVQDRKLTDCSECTDYPCEIFLSRKGLSHAEADGIEELDIPSYYEYLGAYDNQSRLDRLKEIDKKIPFWEKAYRNKDINAFSSEPNGTLKEFEYLLDRQAKILEAGCGEGQNAFYLARQGYSHVDAFDISEHGIAKLRQKCEAEKVQLNAFTADLTTYQFEQSYNMVLCFGTLHFVPREDWRAFINRAKAHTEAAGVHIMQIFTDTVPASADIAPFAVGLAKDGEIAELYADWEILQFKSYTFEDEHPGVPRHLHASNKIVARKRVFLEQ